MSGYWGAEAYYSSGGPNGEGTRYFQMDTDPNFEFTDRPGDGNTTTIEQIHMQVLNQHPEWISALADEWQNAYNLLSNIRQQLLDESNVLYNEHWKAAEARDLFMKSGPGSALAYLDEWMTAADNNRAALRALVDIVIQSRSDMNRLWTDYQNDVEDAKTVDTGTKVKVAFQIWRGWFSTTDAMREEATKAVEEQHKKYNRLAQNLAWNVAEQYFDTYGKINSGYGPPFVPMNAVLNAPHPPYVRPPSPPALPTAPPPPVPPPAPVPPALPADPQGMLRVLAPHLAPPPVPVNVPAPPVAVPLPVAVPVAVLPAVPAGVAQVPGVGANSPVGLSRSLGATGTAGLRSGILQARSAASVSAEVPGGMRAPMPPMAGRTLTSRKPPAPARSEQSTAPTPSAETEEPFARAPGGTAPPVLNSQRPGRARPGSREEFGPPARGTDLSGPPLAGRPSATPPVLTSPGATGTAVEHGAGPPPLGRGQSGGQSAPGRTLPPAQPGAPGRGRSAKQKGGPATPSGADWVGADAALADASAPVLDAPELPPTGTAVSGLEEVPKHLRTGRAAAARAARTGSPRGTVSPELATRRVTPAAANAKPAEGDRLVTDEDAFTVDTPGGGVLAKQADEPARRAEPPAALSQ
ncbi:MAG TPA: hypothetical protein VFE14_18395 [Micromonosporaceae bacterium]|jgi:hypothetical protein|nr:hypothetical protein [Micromonosporaceae bacterium]